MISGIHPPPSLSVSATLAESEESMPFQVPFKCSTCWGEEMRDCLSWENRSGSASSSIPPDSEAKTDAMVPSSFPKFFLGDEEVGAGAKGGGVGVVEDDDGSSEDLSCDGVA